eukprot:1158435_1
MKRKRQLLSDDDDHMVTAPQTKKRRKNRFISSSEEENSVSPIKSNSNNSQTKHKQSNLSSFFNVPSPLQRTAPSESDSDSEYDYYLDENDPKWNCNQIRNKIRKLLSTPGFKITHWLRELDINSNSYQRYMKLKGKWNNTSNQTFCSAHGYFMKQEELKKKEKAKEKNKSAKQKKKDAAKRKKEKENAKRKVEQILEGIKQVEQNGYDEDGAIFDDCNDVRKNVLLFLKRGVMTKSRFLKEIGNVAFNSYSSFASMGPLKLSGASNQTYPKAYHWLEKLRIAEGVNKSKKRLQNEDYYPDGFPLSHDNGRRICFSGQRCVIKGDIVVVQ